MHNHCSSWIRQFYDAKLINESPYQRLVVYLADRSSFILVALFIVVRLVTVALPRNPS